MSPVARSWPGEGGTLLAAAGEERRLPRVWRLHGRRLLWWSPAVLVMLAAVILTPLAAVYQPLRPGGAGGGSFPGMRTGTGIRWISQYIPMPDAPEMYVPAQRGSFALAASVVNRGSFPVTIVGVGQAPGSPFTPAGPARYQTSAEFGTLRPGHLLRDVTLRPGQGIMIGMPLRIAYCADRRTYVGEDVFVVTERFFGFTHVVPMPFVDYGRPVITNAPGGQPGQAGAFCSGS